MRYMQKLSLPKTTIIGFPRINLTSLPLPASDGRIIRNKAKHQTVLA